MKKLLFSVLMCVAALPVIINAEEEATESDKAEEAEAKADVAAAAKVKERTLGDRVKNLASPLVSCDCKQGTRMTIDCSKECTGVLRGGWKEKSIELTNKGFRCICNRKNYGVECTSLFYPKACGRAGKSWTGKVSWNATVGGVVKGRTFDTKTQKTAESCVLPQQ